MNIALFTKTEMCGGSEIRAVELCNAIARYTSHKAFFCSERDCPPELQGRLSPQVKSITNLFGPAANFEILYEMDAIVVINTDSKHFTTLEYWDGRSSRHSHKVNLTRLKQMTFLFNFIVSPGRHLWQLEQLCPDVRVIAANARFLNEIARNKRYVQIRHLPRTILESPIDPDTVTTEKVAGAKIRIGKHSHPLGNKFNEEHLRLIESVNRKHGDEIEWDFMGVPQEREAELRNIPNVVCRQTFSLSVSEYLRSIHIFLFFISWTRQEPWARAVGEAMASGCPILATDTDGGNRTQVVDGSNGYLCASVEDFEERICDLVENRAKLVAMGRNSRIYARSFTSEEIVRKLLNFIGPLNERL